jgi:hypothetical protein
MDSENDSMKYFISKIISKKDMTVFYTSISVLWGKTVDKCKIDREFLSKLVSLKNNVDDLEQYRNISVDSEEDTDYDEADYSYACHSFCQLFYIKEFFNSVYLSKIQENEIWEKGMNQRKEEKRIQTNLISEFYRNEAKKNPVYYHCGKMISKESFEALSKLD